MNEIKTLDILEKSTFALEELFHSKINLDEKFSSINLINGKLSIDNNEFFYIIHTKPTISRLALLTDSIKSKESRFHPLLFVIDYASRELIKYLKKKNIFFVDTVGNCYINTPDFKVSVEGRKAVYKDLSIKRAFQKTGLKFLYKIFQNPDLLNGTYRKVASNTKISLASVSYIIDELKTEGFIVELLNPNQRHLCNLNSLINKWAISYGEILRPKVHRGYFRQLDPQLLKTFLIDNPIEKDDIFLSGEYGVYHFNQSIKPEKLIIYTNIRLSKLAQKYKIVPTGNIDKNRGNIEILEAFWLDSNKNIKKTTINDNAQPSFLVHPILIYADLLLSNNYRSIETAENLLQNEIRDKYLRHNFQW